jgi:hypothetical protein
MARSADILVFGTGNFAARMVFDVAATALAPVSVAIAGRRPERLAWLRTAGHARAAMFGRPVTIGTVKADLSSPDAAADVIAKLEPRVIVQAASVQAGSVISRQDDAWSRLVAEGGLSATAVFQALLTARVARGLQQTGLGADLVNCCYADVVNGLIAALGLPITCGVGNVAILATAFAGELGLAKYRQLKVLAHYQTIGPWRRPPEQRHGPVPRVWVDGLEVRDVLAAFAGVQLTPEPVIDISGASGVPLLQAMAAGADWSGHVPGPCGLPGGYPAALTNGELDLDLPAGLGREEAIRWNARFEEEHGLVVGPDGRARYTGSLREKLRVHSPELAEGFAVTDLDSVYREMEALRARLLDSSGS